MGESRTPSFPYNHLAVLGFDKLQPYVPPARSQRVAMIVKVQVSQFSTDGATRVLIYDESREFTYEGGINEDMIETMAGRPKAYFEASMGPDGLEIGDELEDLDW